MFSEFRSEECVCVCVYIASFHNGTEAFAWMLLSSVFDTKEEFGAYVLIV